MSDLGEDLMKATEPLRRPTTAERKRALKFMGLDEDAQIQCSRCRHWKSPDDFYTRGVHEGKQLYEGVCKPCKRLGTALRKMDKKQCRVCGVIKNAVDFRHDVKRELRDSVVREYVYVRNTCRQCDSARRGATK